jgi:hypothetical protein
MFEKTKTPPAPVQPGTAQVGPLPSLNATTQFAAAEFFPLTPQYSFRGKTRPNATPSPSPSPADRRSQNAKTKARQFSGADFTPSSQMPPAQEPAASRGMSTRRITAHIP